MKHSSDTLINKKVAAHKEWLRTTGINVLDDASASLRVFSAESTLPSLLKASTRLSMLGTYYGARGVVNLTENTKGDDSIGRSALYYSYYAKARLELHRRLPTAPSLVPTLDITASTLCYCIANDIEDCQHLSEILFQINSSIDSQERNYWNDRIFEPFVLNLYRIRHERENIPSIIKGDDVYSQLLMRWDDKSQFEKSLYDICEYHCQNIHDKKSRKVEFRDPPFDIIPWEILAIKKIRQMRNEDFTILEHPILRILDGLELTGFKNDELLEIARNMMTRLFG